MSIDDLDIGKCPYCDGELIEYWNGYDEYYECENCGVRIVIE